MDSGAVSGVRASGSALEAEPELDRQFICVPLTDVTKSSDLARLFAVNAMVFKCDCGPRVSEAAGELAALMQDLIDVSDSVDREAQRTLCGHVYGVVLELRRLGHAVSIGHALLDVRAGSSSRSSERRSWEVLCVVLRDAQKAMPVALIPTPMTIA